MDARELAATWKDRAADLRAYGAEPQALALDRCAEDLLRWIRSHQAEVLTMAEAGEESGYAPDTIRKKIAAGELPNAGRPNAPRIRRGDLPRKTATPRNDAETVLDIERAARRIAGGR